MRKFQSTLSRCYHFLSVKKVTSCKNIIVLQLNFPKQFLYSLQLFLLEKYFFLVKFTFLNKEHKFCSTVFSPLVTDGKILFHIAQRNEKNFKKEEKDSSIASTKDYFFIYFNAIFWKVIKLLTLLFCIKFLLEINCNMQLGICFYI